MKQETSPIVAASSNPVASLPATLSAGIRWALRFVVTQALAFLGFFMMMPMAIAWILIGCILLMFVWPNVGGLLLGSILALGSGQAASFFQGGEFVVDYELGRAAEEGGADQINPFMSIWRFYVWSSLALYIVGTAWTSFRPPRPRRTLSSKWRRVALCSAGAFAAMLLIVLVGGDRPLSGGIGAWLSLFVFMTVTLLVTGLWSVTFRHWTESMILWLNRDSDDRAGITSVR